MQGDARCQIALNTNHYAGIGDVNKRTFELGGMGAFQLTDNRPALGEYFEIGKEVVTFDGRADLREKVEYYPRPVERQQIAAAAAAAPTATTPSRNDSKCYSAPLDFTPVRPCPREAGTFVPKVPAGNPQQQ